MKLLKLLEGLYQELKRYNDIKENEEKRYRLDKPLADISALEKLDLKKWIRECLEKREIKLERHIHLLNPTYSFLGDNTTDASPLVLRTIRDGLGYSSFDDLLAAWRQEQGGAA